MKTNILLPLVVTAGLLIARPARADVIFADSIAVSGNIQQAVNAEPFTDAPKTSLTIESILKLLGITNVKAPDLDYYSRESDGAIILAAKGAKAGDDVSTVAVVFNQVKEPTLVQYDSEHGVAFTKCAFNSTLKGTAYQDIGQSGGTFTVKSHFVVGGKFKGTPTIIKGTVSDVYSTQ